MLSHAICVPIDVPFKTRRPAPIGEDNAAKRFRPPSGSLTARAPASVGSALPTGWSSAGYFLLMGTAGMVIAGGRREG